MKLADETFNRFKIEAWLIGRIGEVAHPDLPVARQLLRAEITRGATTFEIRRDRIAEQINRFDLADRRVGSKVSGPETFAQCYERFYGEALPEKLTGEFA